jgi:hypothetical protein
MSICDIFDQLVSTYGKPTPDAMRQNNINFLAAYNPQDPPEILFKQCTNVQEIATLAKNPYTTQQLLINAIDLLARCGLYQRDLAHKRQQQSTSMQHKRTHLSSNLPGTQHNYINNSKP